MAQTCATVTVQRCAEQSQLGEPRNELDGEALGGETLGHERRDFAIDEPRDGVADEALVIVEQRSDVEEIDGLGRAHITHRAAEWPPDSCHGLRASAARR